MKNSKIKYTIAIVSYNSIDYLHRSIQSAVNQNYDSFEVIVVDDCSTDGSQELLRNYKNAIRVFSTQENSGSAGAPRNIAIDNARGEYLLFLDSDDELYSRDILLKIDRVIGEDKYDIIYLGYERIDENKNATLRLSTPLNSTKEARILCDESFSVSSKCWNIDFLREQEIKFKENMFYEDELFSITTNILSDKTAFGSFPIFKYYRGVEGSVMTKPTIKKASDWYRMLAEVVDIYEMAPEETRKALLSFIKNEHDSLPMRINIIIDALRNNTNILSMPKREYEYNEYFEVCE